MDNLEWLNKHMRDHLSNSARIELDDRVLSFPVASAATSRNGETRDGETALELVYQAAEMVRGIENRATEFESRARGLAEQANEKLKLAERHIHDLEVKQQAAETCIQQAHLKLQEAGEALKRERARVQAAENRLPQLEMRARSAEARAQECERALSRIEDAIRTQILGQEAPAAARSTVVA